MKKLACLLTLSLMAIASPAAAAEGDYTPEDDAIMSRCVDLARTGANGDEATGEAQPSGPGSLADCIGIASGPCMETPEGMSTVGMSACLARETSWWDMMLNANYKSLRETLDEETFASLRDAQRAWIAYSGRNCEFQYTYWRDGTIRSTFYSNCVLDMTARRAIELDQIIAWAQ